MASTLVATSDLDAVNVMLGTIGEQPVSSLEVSGLTDVAVAKSILHETNRLVQAQGWDFNTDLKFRLSRDVNNQIAVPPDALRIDPTYASVRLVARAGYMYDRDNNTFVLGDNYDFDIVRFLAFNNLPEAARYYVTIRAARIFQRRVLGDDTIEAYTEQDELQARITLEDADSETADRNALNDPELYAAVRGGRDPYAIYGNY